MSHITLDVIYFEVAGMSTIPKNKIFPEQNMFFSQIKKVYYYPLLLSLTIYGFLLELTWIDKVMLFKVKLKKPLKQNFMLRKKSLGLLDGKLST